jgi:hypothetical protein
VKEYFVEILRAKIVFTKNKNGANCNLHESRNHIVRFAMAFTLVNWKFASSTHGIGFAQINSARLNNL